MHLLTRITRRRLRLSPLPRGGAQRPVPPPCLRASVPPCLPFLSTLTFENFDPPWFWICLIIVIAIVLGLTYRGIWQRSGRRLTWFLLTMRALGVLALLIALIKPAWLDRFRHEQRPLVAVVVDDSQSMSLPHGDAEDWSPRYRKALRWLSDGPAGRALRSACALVLFNIDGEPVEALPDEPGRERTDLWRGLEGAAARTRGRHVAGVLLISDGQDTTDRRADAALVEYPLPVYAIGYSQPPGDTAPLDLAVVSVEAPPLARVHNRVPVEVLLRKDGGGAVTVPLAITRGGEELVRRTVSLGAGATRAAVTLEYTPHAAGDCVLNVQLGTAPSERTATNNSAPFAIRVEAEPIRVLYVEGQLRPEYTFLRDHLANDPDVDLITFVRSANPDQVSIAGVLMDDQVLSGARLQELDVVLLGDFEARMLDERAYETLRAWVDGGGGLMVLGAYSNLGPEGLGTTALAEALPVQLTATGGQLDEPFNFELTEIGQRHPAMMLSPDIAADAAQWRGLPRLKGAVVIGDARAGAAVLARHPASPLDAGGQGPIVLATQAYGKGLSALLTADTTWRWSRIPRLAGQPDTLYKRFWSQLVRWLARRDPRSDTPALSVTTDKPSYTRGRRAIIRVRSNAAALPGGGPDSATEATLELTVRSPDGRVARPPARRDSADPGRWTAEYHPDRGGRYQIEAVLSTGRPLASAVAPFIVQGAALELASPATNPAALRQVANATGGLYADIDDGPAAAALVRSLPTEPRITYETRTRHAWNSPVLFLFFLVVITTEWIVRRRNQMV